MVEKPKTREVEFIELVRLGHTSYPAGSRATFEYEEASNYIWRGWARDPRTGEQGEKFTGPHVLNVENITHGVNLSAPSSRTVNPADKSETLKPVTRPQALRTSILDALKKLNYDAKAIPSSPPGRPGVRKEVRDFLQSRSYIADRAFEKEWQAMRNDKEILDA